MVGELARLMHSKDDRADWPQLKLRPPHLAELVQLIDDGKISTSQAKDVFAETYRTGAPPSQVVDSKGLAQISGQDALAPIIQKVIDDHPDAAADYRNGKQEALKFLVGMTMRATKGQANPKQATDLLAAALNE